MSSEQKGIFIRAVGGMWKELEFGFNLSQQFPSDLAATDVEYLYLAVPMNNGGYFTGHLACIRKITITPAKDNGNRIYSFEVSKLVRPSTPIGQLQNAVDNYKNGETFYYDFEQVFKDAEASDNPGEKVRENPAELGLPSLSISEATQRLADTYGIEPRKITISISG